MRIVPRSSISLAFFLSIALAACQGGDEQAEGGPPAPADTTAADTASTAGSTTGISPGGPLARVEVTNPMPHAMTVRVEFAEGGSRRLGTIPPNGTQSFRLAASPGETVRLIATDEDETHSPSTRITLEERSSWTIGE